MGNISFESVNACFAAMPNVVVHPTITMPVAVYNEKSYPVSTVIIGHSLTGPETFCDEYVKMQLRLTPGTTVNIFPYEFIPYDYVDETDGKTYTRYKYRAAVAVE